MITNLDLPNATVNSCNVKGMYKFHLLVPDWCQACVHSVHLAECNQGKNCSQCAIGLEAWLRWKSNMNVALNLTITYNLLVMGRSAWIILKLINYQFKLISELHKQFIQLNEEGEVLTLANDASW